MKLNHQKVSDKLYSMIPGVKNYDFVQYGEHTCRVRFTTLATHNPQFTSYHLNKIGEEFGDNEITIFPGQYEFHLVFMVTNKDYYEGE